MPEYRDPFDDQTPGSSGPYLTLHVSWGDTTREVLALIDSGADGSQIPEVTAQQLGLRQVDTIDVHDANGNVQERPVYIANLTFADQVFNFVEVVGSDYPVALVGRDVLNELVTTLNGPGRVFDFVRPAANAPQQPVAQSPA